MSLVKRTSLPTFTGKSYHCSDHAFDIIADYDRYASDVMSTLSDDLNDSDYVKKAGAFFAYAWYDPAMVREPHVLEPLG
jgi:hypothetical protein